jgi:hypothetical protein
MSEIKDESSHTAKIISLDLLRQHRRIKNGRLSPPSGGALRSLSGKDAEVVVVSGMRPHCRLFAAFMYKLQIDWGGLIRFTEIDIDQDTNALAMTGLQKVPGLLFLFDGKRIDSGCGAVDYKVLKKFIENCYSKCTGQTGLAIYEGSAELRFEAAAAAAQIDVTSVSEAVYTELERFAPLLDEDLAKKVERAQYMLKAGVISKDDFERWCDVAKDEHWAERQLVLRPLHEAFERHVKGIESAASQCFSERASIRVLDAS